MNTSSAKSIEQAYINLREQLKAFIYKRMNDEKLAEDILHDVFIKAYSHIDTLKDPAKLNAWLYQIARNNINDHYRSAKTEVPYELTVTADKTEEVTAMKKLEPAVRAFLRLLPPIYREAIILTEFRGITQKALAQRLSLSVSAAKSRVQRARIMLKELFLRCCQFEFDKFGAVIDYRPSCSDSCSCKEMSS